MVLLMHRNQRRLKLQSRAMTKKRLRNLRSTVTFQILILMILEKKGNFITTLWNTNDCGNIPPGAENLSQEIGRGGKISLFLNRKKTGETKKTAIEVETANVSIDDDIWIMAIKKTKGMLSLQELLIRCQLLNN